MAGRILVGTSSWADPGFIAEWYPPELSARERLPYYAQHFEAVELNSSFYAVPDRSTVESWARITPPAFTFDIKVHRLLSRHTVALDSLPPDLRDRAQTTGKGRVRLTPHIEAALTDRLLESIEPLEDAGKLGALLVQLSPSFSPRRHRLDELESLIERLAPRPVAIELRNRSWVDEDRVSGTLGFLSERGVAFVCVDAPAIDHFTAMPAVDAVTDDRLAYVRAHGRNARGYISGKTVAERFGHVYADEELAEIGHRVSALAEEADEVHLMFNNNRGDDAPRAGIRMRELLGQQTVAAQGPAQQRLV